MYQVMRFGQLSGQALAGEFPARKSALENLREMADREARRLGIKVAGVRHMAKGSVIQLRRGGVIEYVVSGVNGLP